MSKSKGNVISPDRVLRRRSAPTRSGSSTSSSGRPSTTSTGTSRPSRSSRAAAATCGGSGASPPATRRRPRRDAGDAADADGGATTLRAHRPPDHRAGVTADLDRYALQHRGRRLHGAHERDRAPPAAPGPTGPSSTRRSTRCCCCSRRWRRTSPPRPTSAATARHVHDEPWPDRRRRACSSTRRVTMVVQVNGKVRDRIEVDADDRRGRGGARWRSRRRRSSSSSAGPRPAGRRAAAPPRQHRGLSFLAPRAPSGSGRSARREFPPTVAIRRHLVYNSKVSSDAALLAHLYRRAGFGATPAQLDHLVKLGFDQAVDQLVAGLGEKDHAGDAVPLPHLTTLPELQVPGYQYNGYEEFVNLTEWWIERMIVTDTPLREKLTLFLHEQFPTVVRQGQTRLHDVRARTSSSASSGPAASTPCAGRGEDPAMLIWLDADTDTARRPNQNFARELMERFTMGVRQLHRARRRSRPRGPSPDGSSTRTTGQFFFNRYDHDTGIKTFLGHPGRLEGRTSSTSSPTPAASRDLGHRAAVDLARLPGRPRRPGRPRAGGRRSRRT